MLVHCPHCQGSFDLASETTAPVVCAACRRSVETFKWFVRDANNASVVTVYNTISLLKIGILANAVEEQDELSKSGRRWLPIASIPELARLFQGPGSPEVFGADAPTISAYGAGSPDGDVVDAVVASAALSGKESETVTGPSTSSEPARSIEGLFGDGDSDDDSFVAAPRPRWPWALVGLTLLVGVALWALLYGPWSERRSPEEPASVTVRDPEDARAGSPQDSVRPARAVKVIDATTLRETLGAEPDVVEVEAELASDAESAPEPREEIKPESAARRMARLALETPPDQAVAPSLGGSDPAKPTPAPKSKPKPKTKPKTRSTPKLSNTDGNTRSFDAWMKDGDRLLATSPSKALNAYIHAYSINPWGARVLTRLGDTYLRLGETDRAVSHYQRSTGKHPQYGPAYVGLGEAFIARGDPGEARRVLTYYMQRFPNGSQRARVNGLLNRL